MDGFKKLVKADIDIIRKYTEASGTMNCEFAPANVLWWNEDLYYGIIEGKLVYRKVYEEYAVYSPLCFGDSVRKITEILTEDAEYMNKKTVFNNLSENMKDMLESEYPERFRYGYDRNDSDYIYCVQDLIRLTGSAYHSKKNMYNHFVKNYNYTYEEINSDNLDECMDMKNRWVIMENNEAESGIIDEAFKNYNEMNFKGGLIRVNGKVEAFTVGESLGKDVFVIHFEKADKSYSGIYQAINRLFLENSVSDYVYVNREDDMGIEGLRKSKLSYNPALIYNKYHAYITN